MAEAELCLLYLSIYIMTTKRIYQVKYPVLITINIKKRYPLFEEQICAEIAANCLHESAKIHKFKLLCFIIMPEHIHILLKNTREKNMSQIMQHYKSYVYHQIRQCTEIKEKFWQRSFDYRIKFTLASFNNAVDYIKTNPFKKELPEKYHKLPYFYENKYIIDSMRDIYI